jgi:adenylate cyclase
MPHANPVKILPLKVVAGYGKELLARAPVSRPGRAALVETPITLRPVKRAERTRVLEGLERIVGSADFDASRRSREFLRFIVEETLAGRGGTLTQAAIATGVFDRRGDFDALVDPIVRIQAGRLRRSLERYYLLSGVGDTLRIDLPRGTYMPVFRFLPEKRAADVRARDEAVSAVSLAGDWPAVAVSGFEPTAPGTGQEEAAALLMEALVLELGRYPEVRALLQSELDRQPSSRTDQVRFSLKGRLHQEEAGFRVTVRLVDHATGGQVWGDEYHSAAGPGRWSGSLDDIGRVIAARVGAEEGVLVQLLAGENRKRGPGPLTPCRAILLSHDFLLANDPDRLAAAVAALRQVVAAEPECGPAWTWLARLYLHNHAFEVTEMPTPVEQAIACAQAGVRVDPTSRRARAMLASALLVRGELAAARHELEEALRLSPDSLVYLEVIGFLLSLLGDGARGAALIRTARERNPHGLPHGAFGLWFDHLRRGELERAYEEALAYRSPTFFWRAVMRACCLGHLGRTAEARSEVAEILRGKLDFASRGRVLIGRLVKLPDAMSRIVDGLAKAGLTLD